MFTHRSVPAVLAALAATVLSASLALGLTVTHADAPATHSASGAPVAAATEDGTDPWG